jgi:hypothetical protein
MKSDILGAKGAFAMYVFTGLFERERYAKHG